VVELDRLHGPRLKVKRANEHIRDLEGLILDFLTHDPKPYSISIHDEAESGDQVYVVHVAATPPEEWGLIIGDCVHNLRSALDHLAWQLVESNRQTPSENTTFPISATKAKFESPGTQGKMHTFSRDARAAVTALKPYQGGNEALWRIHRLNIIDKHHLLIPVGAAYRNFIVTMRIPKHPDWPAEPGAPEFFPPIALQPKDRMYPLVADAPIFRIMAAARSSPEVDNNYQFTFEIAFGKGDPVEGEPVIPTLRQLADEVERLIEGFAPIIRASSLPQPVTRDQS
jgi:hypothetical protein